ncbi:hypothetical protein HZH66_004351 [Vespula vulgaris]|uniref:Uncharacterized protein n=1 Tax=Vespula vulgaris TaxID=7454 RepID=A0A834KF27_VESVU|nr:hypothetical protein HZH66_004351 [Vespula vulgaris]
MDVVVVVARRIQIGPSWGHENTPAPSPPSPPTSPPPPPSPSPSPSLNVVPESSACRSIATILARFNAN